MNGDQGKGNKKYNEEKAGESSDDEPIEFGFVDKAKNAVKKNLAAETDSDSDNDDDSDQDELDFMFDIKSTIEMMSTPFKKEDESDTFCRALRQLSQMAPAEISAILA